ncbi:MAG TPA: hypothetical protein VMF31_01550 [Solirubrobacterales bacterium]|nr:hypothetical protein [Solirubrobacterales bacterium]
MSYLRKQVNPALVLSIVAVFIALGGGAYAAISANSVGTKQLKKNAVTAKKIKKNAVTTAKIKNDAVTGAKVKESSLSAVPLANSATNATNADNAKKVDGYRTFKQTKFDATSGPNFAAATAAAPEQVLFTAGPVTIYAKCTTDTSVPRTDLSFYIKTSENGVAFDSDDDELDGDPDFLNSNTAETDRMILDLNTTANGANIDADSSYATQVFTPGGLSIEVQPGGAVKNGTLVNGNGLYGPGDVCVASASLIERNG